MSYHIRPYPAERLCGRPGSELRAQWQSRWERNGVSRALFGIVGELDVN